MESRLDYRVTIACEVTVSILENSEQKFALTSGNHLKLEVIDISKLGMGLVARQYFPKGLIVELQIDGTVFGVQENIQIKAEVRWCNYVKPSCYRLGVKFINSPEVYVQAIAAFVSEHERRKEPRLKLSD